MTASPSVDAYDAQMLDFSLDHDVPMNITGSAEFFAEALMDHDGHLAASAFSEHPSIEVDMEEYAGDNSEYEMADETTEYQRPHGEELLDVEVYDASHAPSPLAAPQPLPPSVDVAIDPEHQATSATTHSEHSTHSELQGEPEAEAHPAPLDYPADDVSHVEPSASGESVSLGAAASGQPSNTPDESHPPSSESHVQLEDLASTDGQLLEALAPGGTDDEADPPVQPVVEVHTANTEVVPHDSVELRTAESAPPEDADATGVTVQDERVADQAPMTGQEIVDSLYASDSVYIDPPRVVLLSIDSDSEPGFALFNSPDVGGESTEEAPGNQKVYSLLLEDRHTLYYEPLSSVFEALRQDEAFLSCVPHSFEGELALDAHDLQLTVSEDNVHSREISLHDLNVLHDGSDFVGPLRLYLRAIVPRFIIRYYALQEQVQRLHVSTETGEGDRHEEHHEHYDTVEDQPLSQQEEATETPSLTTAFSESFHPPPTTEESVKEPQHALEPTEEAPHEGYELETGLAPNEPGSEYHQGTEEATHALGDENDFENTNTGDEDESAKSDILDADQVHDVAEDADAPIVVAEEAELGGEQTEYLAYVQPEEYDERYGEELSERVEGAFSVQYGEPPHYEEEEEHDTSTAVDGTQNILPGSSENEGDQSAATPTAAHATLEPETSDHIDINSDELVTSRQDISASSSEKLTTSESKIEFDYTTQASGSQEREQSAVQANVFLEVEESDSNFVQMLEREADAEFDRTFSTEQSRQEGSIEATPQDDEAWDEWDDEDAEGDDEKDWIDPDADSNESSVTLSSKASSKRNYDEVDPSVESTVENSQSSPGSKRLRVE